MCQASAPQILNLHPWRAPDKSVSSSIDCTERVLGEAAAIGCIPTWHLGSIARPHLVATGIIAEILVAIVVAALYDKTLMAVSCKDYVDNVTMVF